MDLGMCFERVFEPFAQSAELGKEETEGFVGMAEVLMEEGLDQTAKGPSER